MSFTIIEDGDIFESSMQALVCPVNLEGPMGKGLALEFKRRYLGLEDSYKNFRRQVRAGLYLPAEHESVYVWPEVHFVLQPVRYVVCFPTKRLWRYPSEYALIEDTLWSLDIEVKAFRMTGLAVPALGCGLGGLAWADIRALLECHFTDYTIPVEIYAPPKTP